MDGACEWWSIQAGRQTSSVCERTRVLKYPRTCTYNTYAQINTYTQLHTKTHTHTRVKAGKFCNILNIKSAQLRIARRLRRRRETRALSRNDKRRADKQWILVGCWRVVEPSLSLSTSTSTDGHTGFSEVQKRGLPFRWSWWCFFGVGWVAVLFYVVGWSVGCVRGMRRGMRTPTTTTTTITANKRGSNGIGLMCCWQAPGSGCGGGGGTGGREWLRCLGTGNYGGDAELVGGVGAICLRHNTPGWISIHLPSNESNHINVYSIIPDADT